SQAERIGAAAPCARLSWSLASEVAAFAGEGRTRGMKKIIEHKKIVRWRDYMDSFAAWTALDRKVSWRVRARARSPREAASCAGACARRSSSPWPTHGVRMDRRYARGSPEVPSRGGRARGDVREDRPCSETLGGRRCRAQPSLPRRRDRSRSRGGAPTPLPEQPPRRVRA